MKPRCNLPIPARCLVLAWVFCTTAAWAVAPPQTPAPPPSDYVQHPGLQDRIDPGKIAHVQSEPLPPEHRPPRFGDGIYQQVDYSRPLPAPAQAKGGCNIAQFADATPATIVSVVQAATVGCVNENFGANGALDQVTFTEAKMTAVANAYLAAAQSYSGNNSTQITQLIMFLRTGYYAGDRTTLDFDTAAFRSVLKSAIRAFGERVRVNNFPASAEHGYALRDSLILVRAVDAITENFDTMASVLNHYDSASYRGIFEMRGAVSQVHILSYNLQWEPDSEAHMIVDDQGFREALRDFVRDNCPTDCDLGQTSYLITDAAYELGRFLRITSDATFRQETRDLVKSLTTLYSLENHANVFLKLAEMVHWYDSANCAWYGPGVCTAMQDLQDMILPPSQARVCHDGKLRIRNHDLSSTRLDFICESLQQQKDAFLTLMAVSEDQPVANDHNDTLEVVIFKDQGHYTSYSTTFFGNSTNNGGIYLEGNPATPGNIPRFITFIAPSNWTRPSGVWEPWNLHHEYTHYLDGRYNFHGGFSALPGTAPYSAVWFTEGVGEYMAQFFLSNLPASQFPALADAMALSFLTRNDESVWYVGNEPTRNVPLSTVFNNQYSTSPQDNIYVWGYLATRFMFERHRSDIDAMLALARVGDYAPGYRNWLDNVRNGKDQEFRSWLDCYLLNTGDTVPCNQDVAMRLFKDDFEGAPPPPEPEYIPVNLPLCASSSQLGNACKVEGLQVSGSGTTWLSILPPANASRLWIKTRNGMGDVDLYVAASPTWPYPGTPDTFNSTEDGNTEAVQIDAPGNVWHNIGLHAKNQDYFSGVDIYAYWLLEGEEDIDPSFGDPVDPEDPEDPEQPDIPDLPECEEAATPTLRDGCKISGFSRPASNRAYATVFIPPGTDTTVIRAMGGSGDVDLFGKRGGYPTPEDFDDASTNPGNNEIITLTSPASGWYNLTLQSKDGQGFDNVTLYASFPTEEPAP